MTDSSPPYAHILEREIERGLVELERPAVGLLLSGLSAGLDVGFSVLLMGVMASLFAEHSETVAHLAVAAAYPVGFIFVIAGRSELFTEHTTLAVLPVLARRSRVARLARVWLLVFVANVVGAFLFGTVVALVGPALGVIDRSALIGLGRELTEHTWYITLVSAVLAGWMMGLLSWLVTASEDTVSKILIIVVITGGIGLASLHHCILGTAELAAAWWAEPGMAAESARASVRTAGLATLGNAFGGVFFVALLKFSHARRSGPSAPEIDRDAEDSE
ncbi:MAG: formate/nitrite transporter family protein [Myxococcota bacterium]